MKRSGDYNTKQRAAVFDYLVSLEGAHATAAQILKHFEEEGILIGRTTIYRYLNKLTECGKVRRYTTDGLIGACYQHIDNKENCQTHLHLQCEKCGELQHLECEPLNELQRHILDDHDFKVNALKTVLYGKCNSCLQKA